MLKQHQNQLKLSRKAEDIAAWWQVQLNGRYQKEPSMFDDFSFWKVILFLKHV
jgi:hypothetical protein